MLLLVPCSYVIAAKKSRFLPPKQTAAQPRHAHAHVHSAPVPFCPRTRDAAHAGTELIDSVMAATVQTGIFEADAPPNHVLLNEYSGFSHPSRIFSRGSVLHVVHAAPTPKNPKAARPRAIVQRRAGHGAVATVVMATVVTC